MPFTDLFSGDQADYALPDLVRRHPGKPVLIGEFAAEKDPEHLRRGGWIRDAYRQLIDHPKVVGGIWFHMQGNRLAGQHASAGAGRVPGEVMREPRVSDTFVDVSPPLPRHGRRR